MAFRLLKNLACITFGVLFTSAAIGQTKIGDWVFRSDSSGTVTAPGSAFTTAYSYSGSGPAPKLEIRRKKPGSPVELLVTGTHDEQKENCEYKDWKITIDSTSVPVLGHSFEPAKTVLKTKLKTPENKFWHLFRQGLKLTVQAEQKCDALSGELNQMNLGFSLRGSFVAYKLVLGSED